MPWKSGIDNERIKSNAYGHDSRESYLDIVNILKLIKLETILEVLAVKRVMTYF